MKILLLTTILQGLVPTNRIELSAPSMPNGKWGRWDNCQNGTVVRGFRLKLNYPLTSYFDRQGLVGIQLICGNNSLPNFDNAPTSSFCKHNSEWQEVKMCPNGSFVTSFNLRQDTSEKWMHDDKGATNIKMMCSDGSLLVGNGLENEGNYTGWLHCPKGKCINGIRTKMDDQSLFDDMGLVTLKMACGSITHQKEKKPVKNVLHSKNQEEKRPYIFNIFSVFKHYAGYYNPIHRNFTSNQKTNHSKTLVHFLRIPPSQVKPSNGTNVLNESGDISKNKSKLKQIVTSKLELVNKTKIESKTGIKSDSKNENKTISEAERELTSDNINNKGMLKIVVKNNTSALKNISSYKDPYLNLPILFDIIVLIAVGIILFMAGFLCNKYYLYKFQEKHLQCTKKDSTDKIIPVQFKDEKVSK